MIDFKKAIEIAQKYYQEKGQLELTKIYESKNIWVVYAGKRATQIWECRDCNRQRNRRN